ncbi:synaptotagmin 16, partial [Helobdella robusta]|uniref:Synaptotagmin 16 n=1 Tax=Helobdella robusta TaxID=6412 RepID=T1G214_HELRO
LRRLTLIIHEARDLPSRERGGAIQTQVRMLLLPIKKHRHKTKVVVAAESNPQFNETFDFKVPTDDLTSMGLRMRLYGCERLKKDRLIGETIVNFNRLNTNNVPFWTPLDPRSNLMHGDSMSSVSSNLTHSESDSSTHSLNHAGTLELMLGVAYNGVTGRMAVEVIKGSNFKNMAAKRPPDTYVKLALMAPNGQEISRSKTSIRRGQPNPLYKETFMFQVPQFQLPDVSLMVSVFVQKSLKRKEMIGWFTMGRRNTNSSEDDASHWTAMLESKGEQVCRWHVLLEP